MPIKLRCELDFLCGKAILFRAEHIFRPHDRIEILVADIAQPQRVLAQCGAVGMHRLGDLVLADLGCKRGHQHEGTLHLSGDARLVGLDPVHAAFGERNGGISASRRADCSSVAARTDL